MATETPAQPLDQPSSAIENEIPSYRAISPMAVASLVFGVLALFTFTSTTWWITMFFNVLAGTWQDPPISALYYVSAILAILTGRLALRKIRKYPDLFTGASFARAGIALGIIFPIASLAYAASQEWILRSDGMRFARKVTVTLNSKNVKDALWFMLPPEMRKGLTPDAADAQLEKLMDSAERIRNVVIAIQQMNEHLAASGQPIRISGVESAMYTDVVGYVSVLLKVGDGEGADHDHDHDHGEAAKDAKPHKPGEDFALLVLKGEPDIRGGKWYVEQIRYPYQPKSFKPVVKQVIDDGHGHGPGGH